MSRDVRNLLELLNSNKRIAILAHKTPDTDAFASVMALREIIRKFHSTTPEGNKIRRRIDVFLDYDQLPTFLNIFLPNNDEKIKFLNPENALKSYDLAIALDCASEERMGKYTEIFSNAKNKVNIDHHATNTKFGDINYVTKTSSTCEALFYMFLYKQKFEVSNYILSLLYSGILTDTNNLKNNADSPTTEKAVAYLKQNLGASLAKKIRANFFENNSPAKDILYSYAYNLKNRQYFVDDKLCVITLDNKAFTKANAEISDAEGIVDEALYRKGVAISAIILEKNKNEIDVKLRGKQGIDVSELAKKFRGGGHPGQAGFQYTGKLNTFMNEFIPVAKAFAEKAQEENLDNCLELFE